jgi:predicted ArsR family transcriptional regulator
MATDLTKRQKDVLRLVREGKNPTEIGKELGISSQGVHGHMRRLRDRGLLPAADRAKPAGRPRATANHKVSPTSALEAVRATVREQLEAIDARQAAIEREITALTEERDQLDTARTELQSRFGDASEASEK